MGRSSVLSFAIEREAAGEAKQKGAPVRGKKTGELTEDPGFAEQPDIARPAQS